MPADAHGGDSSNCHARPRRSARGPGSRSPTTSRSRPRPVMPPSTPNRSDRRAAAGPRSRRTSPPPGSRVRTSRGSDRRKSRGRRRRRASTKRLPSPTLSACHRRSSVRHCSPQGCWGHWAGGGVRRCGSRRPALCDAGWGTSSLRRRGTPPMHAMRCWPAPNRTSSVPGPCSAHAGGRPRGRGTPAAGRARGLAHAGNPVSAACGALGRAPEPWKAGQGPNTWTVARADVPHTVPVAHDVPAPFPGLVSLGVREHTRLLLNLESAPGLVSVTGAAEDRVAVLASMAAELGTSGWSDRLTVTLTGFGAELTALAPDRIRHAPDVSGVLEVMERETETRRSRLRGASRSGVLTGRLAVTGAEQWAPHLVLVGAEPSPGEAARLAALASGADALGIGYVVATERAEHPGVVWPFTIDAGRRLRFDVMGLDLQARPASGEGASRGGRTVRLRAGEEPDNHDRARLGPRFTVDLSEQGRPAGVRAADGRLRTRRPPGAPDGARSSIAARSAGPAAPAPGRRPPAGCSPRPCGRAG